MTQVTVLTGYIDPTGHRFEMNRNAAGDLLSITTPSGKWLHFEPDGEHRIRAISDSLGRSVKYGYDEGGRLVHVAASQGVSESYAYDERGQMISVKDAAGITILLNKYSSGGQILHQELADGRRFEYRYKFGGRNILIQNTFTDPSGLITYFDYCANGYRESLPTFPPH
jgi:YD repeat-containing protein